ncbi:hypothetical protein [Paenarthrobacter sp. C1]|uniref:hypothetical protein n=1 Tax=Paenarthrobacter sp. C1 TaxID=3400220 RepID=UPI003BF5A21C
MNPTKLTHADTGVRPAWHQAAENVLCALALALLLGSFGRMVWQLIHLELVGLAWTAALAWAAAAGVVLALGAVEGVDYRLAARRRAAALPAQRHLTVVR